MPEAAPPGGHSAWEADRDLLIEAAIAGGAVALAHHGASPRHWEKSGGQGPVSEADLAVNAVLAERLRTARPGYGWLSEEDEDGPERLSAERVFVVDPIDGTRAFIAGEPGFSVSIAVVEAGRPVAAAVHLPARGQTYAAALGTGATRDGRPLILLPSGGHKPIVLATKAALDPRHWPGGLPQHDRQFRPSLAWRLCLVADGRFDATVTVRPAWEWDVAAGCLIAAEAGAAATDADGAPLGFNGHTPRVPSLIVARPRLHTTLVSARRAP